MLTRVVYNAIKDAFGQTVTEVELPIFKAATLDEQLTILKDVVDAHRGLTTLRQVTDAEIACFVLLFNLKANPSLYPAGSKAHFDLRERLKIPAPGGWHKPNPPTSYFELVDPNRQPSWAEEQMKVPYMADLLDFEAAKNADDIVDAIKTILGIGGFEDFEDPRALTGADPTMHTFVEAVKYQLSSSRMNWFQGRRQLDKLPEGVDGRRKFDIEEDMRFAREAEKLEQKRKAERDRREQTMATYNKQKSDLAAQLETLSWKPIVDATLLRDFNELKENVEAKAKAGKTWMPGAFLQQMIDKVKPTAPGGTEKTKEALVETVRLTEQFIFVKMNQVKPSWFQVLANGDLKLRKAPLKAPGLTRSERAAQSACAKLATKYGTLELAKAALAVLGVSKAVHEVYGALPDKPQAGVSEESEVEAKPEEVAAGE